VPCAEIAERLPELLNGSLEAGERARLEAHLQGCAACRQELHEVRLAAAVFAAHLPSDALVALAWDRPPSGLDPELARRHLELCPECAAELQQVLESRALETEVAQVVPLRRPLPPRRWLGHGAVSAALVAAFAGGAWWRGTREERRLAESEVRGAELATRLASAEEKARELQASAAELAADRQRLAAPQLNVPVLELLPGSPQARQAGGGTAELALPASAPYALLMLSLPEAATQPIAAELRDGKDALVWKGSGLRANSLGAYSLGIPAALLPEGPLRIVLSAPGAARQSFEFRVRRTP